MNRCPICPGHRNPVPSTGPKPARVLFLGEGPNFEEDRTGEPFRGKTGLELTGTYFPILGLPRSAVHIFNAMACSNRGYVNPTPAQAMACSSCHLGPLLHEIRPEIIVPMGAVACSLFPEIESLALQHGRAIHGKWGSWSGILFPMFHPSAGLRATGYMIAMMQDMDDLRKLLANLDVYQRVEEEGGITDGWTPFPVDPYPEPDYQFIRTEDDLVDYMSYWGTRDTSLITPVLGEDTESLPGSLGKMGGGPPFCLTFSHTPGTGRLIYVKDKHLIDAYRKMLYELLPLQLFHNYLHDSDVFDTLQLPTEPFLDTMVRAYNLCLGGGGDDEEEGESRAGRGSLSLKVLTYRHCQMQMTSFKDTVWPHSLPHVLTWLKLGRSTFAPDSDREPVCECGCEGKWHEPRGKTGKQTGACLNCNRCSKWVKVKKPVGVEGGKVLNLLHRKLNTLIVNVETGKLDKSGKPKDPWKQFLDWSDYDQRTLLDTLGPIPLASIEHVPEPELLHYAVRDADADLRLYLKMQGMSPWIFYGNYIHEYSGTENKGER
jgi:DNA polymerase